MNEDAPWLMPFSGNPLDRSSNQRHDDAWLEQQAAALDARYLAFWKLNVLVSDADSTGLVWLDAGVSAHLPEGASPYLLGVQGGLAHYAVDLSALDEPLTALGLEGARFSEPRGVGLSLTAAEAGILAHGRALVDWHTRHRFCGVCGSPTLVREGGGSRVCEGCGAHHFPRTDPSVIMVVWSGDRCLLGRRPNSAPGRFSPFAGYIDQGETIEEAVRREVREEAGVAIDDVAYYASQPWPFPSTLMIGCFAHAVSEDFGVDGAEILEARWFTREELREAMDSPATSAFAFPDRLAIAHHLIRAWVDQKPD